MEVVCPVGMFVYTAVYMLAADGAVFDTPKKKSMVHTGSSDTCEVCAYTTKGNIPTEKEKHATHVYSSVHACF